MGRNTLLPVDQELKVRSGISSCFEKLIWIHLNIPISNPFRSHFLHVSKGVGHAFSCIISFFLFRDYCHYAECQLIYSYTSLIWRKACMYIRISITHKLPSAKRGSQCIYLHQAVGLEIVSNTGEGCSSRLSSDLVSTFKNISVQDHMHHFNNV